MPIISWITQFDGSKHSSYTFRLVRWVDSYTYDVSFSPSGLFNTWFHLGIRNAAAGQPLEIFINGYLLATANPTPSGPIAIGSGKLAFGRKIADVHGYYGTVRVDEFKTWKWTLDDAQMYTVHYL